MSEYADITAFLKQKIADQCDFGINLSRNSFQNSEILVQETGRCLKQIRSLFYLFKPIIEEDEYHVLNELIGKTYKLLSQHRESTLNHQSFQELDKLLSLNISSDTRLLIYNCLIEKIKKVYTNNENSFHNKIVGIAFQLSRIRDQIINLQTRVFSETMLVLAIEKNYNKAISFYSKSKISLHGDAIHKWRKYCRYILFELEFYPLESKFELKLFIEKINSLSELLDKEYNMSVLDKVLKYEIYPKINQKEIIILHQIIEKERHTFQKKAFWLGAEIFSKNSTFPLKYFKFEEKVLPL
jgi:hypothetical protein